MKVIVWILTLYENACDIWEDFWFWNSFKMLIECVGIWYIQQLLLDATRKKVSLSKTIFMNFKSKSSTVWTWCENKYVFNSLGANYPWPNYHIRKTVFMSMRVFKRKTKHNNLLIIITNSNNNNTVTMKFCFVNWQQSSLNVS